MVQPTLVLLGPSTLGPVTEVMNCCVWELERLTDAGLMVNEAGALRVIVELADLVESATLVAVIVTV